jgi:hypothetical protein
VWERAVNRPCLLAIHLLTLDRTIDYFNDESGEMVINTPNVQADRKRYIINDFRADEHYSTRPYVTGFPYMVSYAEVPLISPLGYVLGSYCVVDSKLRDFDTDQTIQVLSEVANTIMRHLDLIRLEQNRARAEKLIKGLGEFMERESTVPNELSRSLSYSESGAPTGSEPPNVSEALDASTELLKESATPGFFIEKGLSTSPLLSHSPSNSGVSAGTDSTSMDRHFSPSSGTTDIVDTPPSTPSHHDEQNPFETVSLVKAGVYTTESKEHSTAAQEPDPPAQTQESIVSTDVRTTFNRAATLIRDTMSMDGLIFLDACPSSFGSRSNHPSPHEREDPFQSDVTDDLPDTVENQVFCEMIAGSWTHDNGQQPLLNTGKRLPEVIVQRFIRRFPRGHVFSADEYGPIDCHFGPGTNPKLRSEKVRRRTSSRAAHDIDELFRFLPGARYIIFLPLWHFQRDTWFSATFGWVREATQAINVDDLNLLSAFGNSVMMEVCRFEALAISRAKSDFISSISHERKSPHIHLTFSHIP